MSRRKRLFGSLVAIVATLAMVWSVAGTAYAEKYDYTVRVFQGNSGKLKNDPVSVTVEKGGRVRLFDIATADVSDSKYVQIGFRLSGTDETIANGVINNITEDMDFVVAYGFEGEIVPFTIKFQEYGTGRQLAEPKTYYGRVGDKPVAAYEYIEGYRPLYRSITGTLKKDVENVWTFEYVALQEGETIEGDTTTTTTDNGITETPGNETVNYVTETVPGETTTTTRTETVPGTTTTQPTTTTDGGTTATTTTTPAGAGGNVNTTTVPINVGNTPSGTTTVTEGTTTSAPAATGGGANAGNAADAAGGNANAAAPAAAGGANEAAPAQEQAPATREILDMDNPLAGPDGGSNASTVGDAASVGRHTNPFIPALIALALAIACGLIFFIWKRKKDSENEPETEE